MYYCENCKTGFDDPHRETEKIYHPEVAEMGITPYVEVATELCPNCMSARIVEGNRCSLCGEVKDKDEPTCEDCRNFIFKHLKHYTAHSNKEAEDAVKEVIAEWIELNA